VFGSSPISIELHYGTFFFSCRKLPGKLL
jgi:hypothetical protein